MAIEEWGIRTDGIRGMKERKGVNETPTRGDSVVCFPAWFDSLFMVVVVDLGLMLKNFLFDIFDISWICFAFNHIFPEILDIFLIFFSFNLSFSYLQAINEKNIKS